jgi:Tol biopolymer transport system component
VAFSWNGAQEDNFDIYVKLIGHGEPLRLTNNPGPDGSPAWSPDGSQIAFIRHGSVFLVSPLGGPERKLADLQARQLGWTPDSKSLAVSSGIEGNIRIVLLSLDTRETRILTSPSGKGFSFGDIYFAISPDGLELAFVRFPTSITADVFLTSMTGGEPRRLTESQFGSVWGLAWTRDGREVIYSAGRGISAALWRRRIEAPPTEQSERLEGVEPGSVEPTISREPRANGVRRTFS